MQEQKPNQESVVEPEQQPAAALEQQAAVEQVEVPAGTSPDVMPSLEESLRQAELKAEEHHDAWLRAKAETENVRRRAQDDIAKAAKFAAEKFAGAMLPVKDSLEAALGTDNQTVEKLREGVELTLKQLVSAFEGANLTEENPVGQKFDPNKHQAIGALESEAEPNTVITVLQKGYLLNERVVRPALVMVAKAKAQ
ncbi:MAG: nucleotide exchange factor GrpE [Azoarcus sp.]|nr:nucleotide exchange factor GrpE [Azoarcus sp.]